MKIEEIKYTYKKDVNQDKESKKCSVYKVFKMSA